MSNTRDFYEAIDRYMIAKRRVDREFSERMAELEKAEGSRLYEEGKLTAEEHRDSETEQLRKKYGAVIDSALEGMRKRISERKAEAPTDEQLRILQTLSLREKVTLSELEAAAKAMDGNALALETIHEIGEKSGFHRSFAEYGKEFPRSEAERIIVNLQHGSAEILQSLASKPARIAAQTHCDLYGGTYDESQLPQLPLFKNKAECLQRLGDRWEPGTGWEQKINEFCDAVD